MEILKKNYLNTTSAVTVDAGTDTVQYLFNNLTFLQYSTDNFNDDNTTAAITVSFDETLSVDTIVLQNHNLKDFTIFYNGTTANTFTLTNPTTVSDFSSNSATSLYLKATPVNCTSVTIDMSSTIVADSEKAIGRLILSEQDIDFTRIPAAKGYKPKYDPMQARHMIADGGMRLHTVSQKYESVVNLKYVPEAMKTSLKTLFDKFDEFIFIPFGTGTSWDGIAPACVWEGDFEFYRYSDDVKTAGFQGKIRLAEVPS